MKRLTSNLTMALLISAFAFISALTARPDEAPTEKATAVAVSSTFVVNSTGDEPDLVPGDDICLTSAGTCTLRAAIQESNADIVADLDTITFSVSAISPATALPVVIQPVEIDGSGGSPRVQLIGSGIAAVNTHGLQLGAGSSGSTIKAMVIRNFTGNGIRITSGNNTVENCYIGTDSTGNTAQGNGAGGIIINSASGNTVGGTSAAKRNVISGNTGDGVAIADTALTNTVAGNYIGLGADGVTDVGNTANGVSIGLASNQQIGGLTTTSGVAPGNVISGNGSSGTSSDGVEINGSGGATSNNKVQGNLIGTSAAGTIARANNGNGVLITGGAQMTTIGGLSSTAGTELGNVISGNSSNGIEISGSGSTANTVQGNLIGLNVTGVVALRNASNGILINGAPGNTIGGSSQAARNIITGGSGANDDGVDIQGDSSDNNTIAGNYIGTDITGASAIGAGGDGVRISSGPDTNTVGGVTLSPGAAPGNLISGNSGDGVDIGGSGTTGNLVYGNIIGLQAGGAASLGNGANGVLLNLATATSVGSTTSNTGNTIAFNAGDGVFVAAGTGNRISSNSIHSNTGLGIDIGSDGVTSNDPSPDSDAGANNLQNFPVIKTAVTGSTVIQSTINSAPNTTFRIEFFSSPAIDPGNFGEGQTYLGFTTATTDASGFAVFTFTTTTTVTVGHYLTATATDPNGNTSEFSEGYQLAALTDAELIGFAATIYRNAVLLEWQTAFEVDNLGFRLYREDERGRLLITPDIIEGSALMAGAALSAGRRYRWVDVSAKAKHDVQYYLEEIDLGGLTRLHSPGSIIDLSDTDIALPSNRNNQLSISKAGRDYDDGESSSVITVAPAATPARATARRLLAQSMVASASSIKIAVKEEGWYRVTQQELIAAGLPRTVIPRLLQLFVDGREVPFIVNGEKDGSLDVTDSIEFYGQGLDTAQTDTRIYYLTQGSQAGKRITTSGGSAAPLADASFAYTIQRKDRRVYFAALKNGDKENFFGPTVAGPPVDQALFIQNADTASQAKPVLEVTLQGATLVMHRVRVQLNAVDIGEVVFNNQSQGAMKFTVEQSLLREGDNQIRLIAQGGPTDISFLDYIRLTFQHRYAADDDALRFTAPGKSRVTLSGFTTTKVRAFDITDPVDIQEISIDSGNGKAGPSISARVTGSGQRVLLALTDAKIKRPVSVRRNEPSDLRQPQAGADFIIITTKELAESLEPLRAFRQSEGLHSAIVDIEDIYDEFSFGQKTSQAEKDFLAYAQVNWQRRPRFILLAGDATLDPRNYTGQGDFDFVPTRLIDTAQMETASDDWLADFDSDGVADIAVGRLPVRTKAEASAFVSKIIAYTQSAAASRVLLVADRNDGFDFRSVNDQLKTAIPGQISVDEADLNQMDAATAKSVILNKIYAGARIVNFAGHGASDLWRWNLLTTTDAAELTNNMLPVFIAMTCMNGFFHDTSIESLAESLIKARGGAIAVWASSGLTFPNAQAVMNREMLRQLFNGVTLGEAAAIAKRAVTDADVRTTWILFGDPTTRLK